MKLAPAPDALAERVQQERYDLLTASIRRLPAASLLMNLFCGWLLWRAGWPAMGIVWALVASSLHLARWSLVQRWRRRPPRRAADGNQLMVRLFLLLGAWLGVLILLVFRSPAQDEYFLATVLCLGIAAGAVVASGWSPQVFALWSLPVCGGLVAGWLSRGGLAGVGIAVLLAALFLVLLAQTRDQERALRRLVSLAWDNERLAASLRAERDRAEAASQSKTRFFAAASHDLRQPLHALSISAYALAMLAARQGDAKVRKLSESIDGALRQSTGLLDGLLDVSRLDAGAVQPEPRDLDLAGLLDSVRYEFAPLASQRGLRLDVELSGPQPMVLRSDPDLLRRVLHNLVGNALKFTRDGGVRLVGAAAPGGGVRISVIDSGCGIPREEQERVFEEFYQVGNAARDRRQGLGLGLAIVRRIAGLLGIELRLDSEPGRGTRIDLLLPAGDAARVGSPAAAAPPAALPAAPPALQLKVLAIDDETEIRDAMATLLEQLGCEARCVDGREQALAAVLAGFKPDVIIADHRLNGHTGLQAIDAVCAVVGPRPALVITGDTAPQTLQQVLASGRRVMHKPVDGAALAQVLRELAEAPRD